MRLKKSNIPLSEAARLLAESGVSFLPVGADKLPAFDLLPKIDGKSTWAPFQNSIPDDETRTSWFNQNAPDGIATIAGAVSGNMEIIDFDVADGICLYKDWAKMVSETDPDLFESLAITTTPSGGVHVRYRCPDTTIPGNLTLAKLSPKQKVIETRGENGYALCPPSTGYKRIQGAVLRLPIITPDMRQALIDAARSFNHVPEVGDVEFAASGSAEGRPGDDYNKADEFKKILLKHGWEQVGSGSSDGKELWKRPGSKNRWSATWNAPECPRMFYIFTDNADPFESGRAYQPFSIFAILEHSGDFKAAAKTLAAIGFGDANGRPEKSTQEAPDEEADRRRLTPTFLTDVPLDRSKLVPEGGWLDKYVRFLEPTLDAPEQFHIACGMFCLSLACNRSYINFGVLRIRPLLWIALVAPSGICRKSTSISAARYLLEEWHGESMTYPGSVSPEAFTKHLADDNETGFFSWSEMQSQMEAFERSYMRGYKADLTDLFDCPRKWSRKTKADGEMVVDDPFVGIIGASTQKWLNDCLSEGDLKGGFLPRFLWVMAFHNSRDFQWPAIPDPDVRADLISHLDTMSNLFIGPMRLSEGALSLYENHCRGLQAAASTASPYDEGLAPFYVRLQSYVLKFSILYQADIQASADQGRRGEIIGEEAMGFAVNLSEYFKDNIQLLLDQMAFNDDMIIWKNILRIINENPGIGRRDLLRFSRQSSKRLDEALATLYDAERITSEKDMGKRGRPKLRYYPLLDEGETDDQSVFI